MEQLTNQAYLELQKQAFYYIFFAKDVEQNLQYIKKFEQTEQIFLLDNFDIGVFLTHLGHVEEYYPIVYQNVFEYVKWARQQLNPKMKAHYSWENNAINDFLFCNQKYQNHYSNLNSYHYLEAQCYHKLARFFLGFESSEIVIQKVTEFLPYLFWFSSQIIAKNLLEQYHLREFLPMFYRYCNFLLYYRSSLLSDPSFKEGILSILKDVNSERKSRKLIWQIENFSK